MKNRICISEVIKTNWLLKYTIFFIIASVLVFWQLVFYGKSFINEHDGYMQALNFLIYWGEYLRNLFRNIFINHDFYIPTFDLSIGLGANISETLHYYGAGDILNLFSVFFSPEKTEILYSVLVFIRLYFAGLTFIIYCKHHKISDGKFSAVLLGTLIYVFSYWTIHTAALHPYFLNAILYFPLILLGVDFVLEKNSPILFIFSCAAAAYTSVYFFYMMTIQAFIYAVIRYFFTFGKQNGVKFFLKKFFIAFFGYLTALFISSPVFLPFARGVLSGGRVGTDVPLLYELLYYIKLPIAFINASADHYTDMGYTIIGLCAILLLIFKTKIKECLELKIFFIIGLFVLMFPFGGHIMNGLGYASNRWIWGFTLLVCIIIIKNYEVLIELKFNYIFILGILAIVTVLPTFFIRSHGLDSYKRMIILFTLCLAFFIFCFIFIKKKQVLVFIITFVSIFLSSYSHYSPYFYGEATMTKDTGVTYTEKMNSLYKLYDDNKIDEERLYRIDTAASDVCSLAPLRNSYEANTAMLFNRYGTTSYYSTNDSRTRHLFNDLSLAVNSDLFYVGLNERAFLEAFLGCRYCSIRTNEKKYIPFGFNTEIFSDKLTTLYENENVLPLVFCYSTYMNEADYESLTPVQKQQALLQVAAVKDSLDITNIKYVTPAILEYTDKEISYKIENVSPEINIDENTFFVKSNDGGCADIVFNSYSKGEYYLVFDGLDYKNGKRTTWNAGEISVSYLNSETNNSFTKSFQIREKNDQAYSDKHNFIYNIGYIDSHDTEMIFRMSFYGAGEYSFKDMKIICQPVENIPDYVAALTQDEIKYNYENGRMFVSCNLNADRILCVSAPFQKGSYALVDGIKQKCFCVNNFATGIIVPPGKHEITVCF
ncbi:MAG: YfhO family protein [Treponema sp.]|nr:YfhO family protein [Treponema sp.]